MKTESKEGKKRSSLGGRGIGVYPGQYYDQETGLHYNYFRYYNPQTGRYITPDPIGFEGGINLFTYTFNNPINAIDPNGLDLILVGSGGPAGGMFMLAAKTWNRENVGNHTIVQVNNGLSALQAMKAYAEKNGGIDGLQVFSHSGTRGLFFDTSNSYASLYSGGLGWLYTFINSEAVRMGQIDPSWFKQGAEVTLWGCETAKGKNSFAEQLSKHLHRSVTGYQSGAAFSGVKNGRPGQGFPPIVPSNYYPVYLVPVGDGFKTFSGR